MANKSLGTLTIDLIAKISGWTQGLDKAERQSAKFRASVQKNLDHAKTALVALGAASVAATAVLIKNSIDSADALSKQAQSIGLSTDQLSAYQYAAALSDVSAEQLTDAFVKMSQAVDDDKEAFKRLGIDLKDSAGNLKDNGTLFEEVAEKISLIEPGARKTALVLDLFSESGAKLIPLLNGGSAGLAEMREEAERLGLVIDQKTASAAEEFNDNLTRLQKVITGTGDDLAAALLPQLVEFSNTLQDPATQQGIKDIVTGLAEMVVQLTKIVGLIPNVTRFLAEEFAAFIGGAALGDLPRLNEELDEVNEKINRLSDPRKGTLNAREKIRLEYLQEEQDRLTQLISLSEEFALSAASPSAPASAPASAPFVPRTSESLKDEAAAAAEWKRQMEEALRAAEDSINALQAIEDARVQMNAGMEREIALYGDTSRAAALRYDLEHGELAGLSEENKAYSIALAEQLDLKQQLAEQAANDEAFATQAAGLQKQIDLLGNTSDATALLYDIEHGAYAQFDQDQRDKLVLLSEELEQREEMLKEFEKQEEERQKIQDEFIRTTQDTLADALRDGTADGAKDALKTFENFLADMAAKAVAADIMKFFKGIGNGPSSGEAGIVEGEWGNTSWLSKIGGAFAGLFDSGGSLGPGQWGIAGENGAEIIRGPANITSTRDTAALMGAKSGSTFNNQFVFPNVRTREEAQQAGSAAARQINRMNAGSGRYA